MNNANVKFDARSIWKNKEKKDDASKSIIKKVIWNVDATIKI